MEIILGTSSRKMQEKIGHMEIRLPSFGGRITLIKASLNSLLIYCLSLFSIQKGAVKEIEKLENHFLWKGEGTV